MIAKAHAKDMLTTPYVFNADEAAAMAKAGADIIVVPHGPDHRRRDRRDTRRSSSKDCPALVDAWAAGGAAGAHRRDRCWCMAARSPSRADAEFILKNTRNCHGFYGASSMERLPVEVALTEQIAEVQTRSAAR